jgi:hypothetical protein
MKRIPSFYEYSYGSLFEADLLDYNSITASNKSISGKNKNFKAIDFKDLQISDESLRVLGMKKGERIVDFNIDKTKSKDSSDKVVNLTKEEAKDLGVDWTKVDFCEVKDYNKQGVLPMSIVLKSGKNSKEYKTFPGFQRGEPSMDAFKAAVSVCRKSGINRIKMDPESIENISIIVEDQDGKESKLFFNKKDERFKKAFKVLNSIISSVDETVKSKLGVSKGKKKEKQDEIQDQSDTYKIMVERACSAISTMRSVLPISVTGDLDSRKPELNSILSDLKISDKLISILRTVTDSEKKYDSVQAHKKMWEDFLKSGENIKEQSIRFEKILGSGSGEEPEKESRLEMVSRMRSDQSDRSSIWLAVNSQAIDFAKSALDIYCKGAISILDDSENKEVQLDLKKISSEYLKPLEKSIETGSFKSKSSKNVSEGIVLNEKEKPNDVPRTIEIQSIKSQLLSLRLEIENIIQFYTNTPQEQEIRQSSKNLVDKIKSSLDYIKSIEGSKIGQAELSKLQEISDATNEMISPDGENSFMVWRKSIEKKYFKGRISSEFIKSGDFKLDKAEELIAKRNQMIDLEKKARGEDIDKIADRLVSYLKNDGDADKAEKDNKKSDRISNKEGGGTTALYNDDMILTKDGLEILKNNISKVLGTQDIDLTDDGQGESVQEIVNKLNLLTGITYTDKDGKIDLEKLNKDMEIFLTRKNDDKNPLIRALVK